MTKQVLALTVAFVLGSAAAAAQSLAEIAQAEAERRERVEAGTIYTNADLPAPVETAPAVPEELFEGAPTAPSSGEEDFKGEDAAADGAGAVDDTFAIAPAADKRDEAFWRGRAASIRTRLNQLRADTAAIRERTMTLRQALADADAAQAPSVAKALQVSSIDLERYQADYRQLELQWIHFEESAREAGVPADWIR